MPAVVVSEKPRTIPRILGWRRVRTPLALAIFFGLMIGLSWKPGPLTWLFRTVSLALITTTIFGLFERWPKRLPRRLARWVLQVLAVGFVAPISAWWILVVSSPQGFWETNDGKHGFGFLTALGVLVAPWVALGALVRQKEALVQHQALAFELERSQLERQASDARLRLLQSQVAPHFLFNTLANVQALVDAGSPQASTVLQSLINYLRAAVPRLNEPATTLGQELQLVRAYLDLMHMRMPDRLQFAVHADPAALTLLCPPMTLLTLVENAVRHGIDPSEEGGRIDIHVQRRDGRCLVWVADTGAGLGQAGGGLGTGLSTLRERLQLTFGGDAQLQVVAQQPKGVYAYLNFPAQGATA